jgi:hypothetical protein
MSSDPVLNHQAYALGKLMALNKISLVYGGAKIGLMGLVANGALDHDGEVIGVIPDFLTSKEILHTNLSELFITKTMHERKLKMHDLCDGFISLPGGFGTFEELFETLTWAQLGLHQKPIGILNTNGFFNDLLAMIENMITKGLLKSNNKELFVVSDATEDLIDKMHDFVPPPIPKWLNKDL